MSEQDDRLDQRDLAQLWHLEMTDRADERAQLEGDRYLSLFLDVLGGKSYVFEHGEDHATDDVSVGDADFEEYDTPEEARIAFRERLQDARADGSLIDPESDDEEIGDATVDGPVMTETGSENLRNDE